MPPPHGFIEHLAELSSSGVPFVCVTMVQAVGSTPQDAGSKMLVTAEGLLAGTVGGGRVEKQAIEHARRMLATPANQTPLTELAEWNLKRDVGMTCGGTVKLFFETYNHSDWRIVVFGAGHVAGAVV
jgi:xanthine dehydrogenase accessory factor